MVVPALALQLWRRNSHFACNARFMHAGLERGEGDTGRERLIQSAWQALTGEPRSDELFDSN